MGVDTVESVVVPAPPEAVFPLVASLDRYPDWMRLVHRADPIVPPDPADRGRPAWSVELRARVGPFARSKQLRMVRSEMREPERVVFERAELDARSHARWALTVDVTPATERGSSSVTMHLEYDGALWTGGVLDRVLDDEVRRARAGLSAIVAG